MGRVRDRKNKEALAEIGARRKRRRLMLEVRQEAAEFASNVRRYADPADAVQQILDNIMDRYEYASQQVYTLSEEDYFEDTITGKVLNHWIREEERLALQVTHIAGKAAAMGLAERQIRLQEAQAAIFATVVDAVLTAHGLDGEMRRQIHEGIANRMEDLVGHAELVSEVPAA
jgi:hypothetical protein